MAEQRTRPASPAWQEGLDSRLLRRLLGRVARPGVVDLTQADAIIARHRNMAGATPLADRINRLWFALADGEAGFAPIVYAQPPSFLPNISNAPVTGAPPKERTRPETAKSESARMSDERTAPSARSPAPSVSSTNGSSTIGAGLHTVVVQGEPPAGTSTMLAPAAHARAGLDDFQEKKPPLRPAGEGWGEGRETIMTPLPLQAGPAPRSAVPQEGKGTRVSSSAEMASDSNRPPEAGAPAAEPPGGDRASAGGSLPIAVAAPVMGPLGGGLAQALPLAGPAGGAETVTRAGPPRDAKVSGAALAVATPLDNRGRTADPVRVTPSGQQTNEAHAQMVPASGEQAEAGTLPIVRERSNAETRWTTRFVHDALPLAGEAPRARERRTARPDLPKPSRARPAAATAPQPGRPMPPPNRDHIAENSAPAGADRQAAPKLDIERLADKVERRLSRRLAIEKERRGRTRWL